MRICIESFRQKIYHYNTLQDKAMRILVVNNYGQFNHLIRRAIREKVETDLISNQTPPEEIDADGLILGGGPTLERAGRCADYLRDLDIPILGICLGMQLMGTTFGGKVIAGSMGGYAEVNVQVLKEDDILKGLPANFKTWASHMDLVSQLPEGFEILARSNVCEIEAMKHLDKAAVRRAMASRGCAHRARPGAPGQFHCPMQEMREDRISELNEAFSEGKKLNAADLAAQIRILGFHCLKCGECCRGEDNSVVVFPQEIRRIQKDHGPAVAGGCGPAGGR